MKDVNSLSHSKRRRRCHIAFAPKHTGQETYGKILRELTKRKETESIDAVCCIDHIHMLVSIPPHLSISEFKEYVRNQLKMDIIND